ncbi:MAG: hypothetical protein Q9195_003943 [Heterodermia aff. obscurata]
MSTHSNPRAPPPRLPRLLCLHGGGTSAMIFKIQTMRLAHCLRPHFHLVYVNAPFPCGPGMGVLPVFESAGPYYRWTPVNPGDDVARVRTAIRKAMIEEGDGMPFVGVMGFSQGAMLAAGILMEQCRTGAGLAGEDVKFKFGVFLVPGFPPLGVDSRYTGLGDKYEYGKGEADSRYHGAIEIPSVHMHGLRDPVVERSRALAKCFPDPDDAGGKGIPKTILEFDTEHHLPLGKAGMADTKVLANAILKTYYGPQWEPDEKASGGTEDDISYLT